jgi:hypothetical protein
MRSDTAGTPSAESSALTVATALVAVDHKHRQAGVAEAAGNRTAKASGAAGDDG